MYLASPCTRFPRSQGLRSTRCRYRGSRCASPPLAERGTPSCTDQVVILETGGVHHGSTAAGTSFTQRTVFFLASRKTVRSVSVCLRARGHDWIVRPDGLILFASSPDMALSVDGPLQNGSQVVLKRHSGKPEPFNQWRWDGSGMLTPLGLTSKTTRRRLL